MTSTDVLTWIQAGEFTLEEAISVGKALFSAIESQALVLQAAKAATKLVDDAVDNLENEKFPTKA